MGTTTKMAIPYPEATGLVKDGWEDMKDIATQVDAKSGLVLLNTTSFSGVASQSFTNIFSSTYDFYRILFTFYGSIGGGHRLRLGSSGTASTAANYEYSNYLLNRANSASTSGGINQTSFFIGTNTATSTSKHINVIDIVNPYGAEKTVLSWFHWSIWDVRQQHGGGVFDANTAFTDCFLIPDSGNITGKAQIYGYNQ